MNRIKTSGHLLAVLSGSLGKFELHVEFPKLCLVILGMSQQYCRKNRKIVHTLLILFYKGWRQISNISGSKMASQVGNALQTKFARHGIPGASEARTESLFWLGGYKESVAREPSPCNERPTASRTYSNGWAPITSIACSCGSF